METINKTNAVCVFTARGIEKILAEGGSKAWVLDAKRAGKREYVVSIQNGHGKNDWGHASAPHHTAFVVGRLKKVVCCETHVNEPDRWLLVFSEYAEINVPKSWPGNHNPVMYGTLEQFGIKLDDLQFYPMPEQEPEDQAETKVKRKVTPLTMTEAKEGLAMTFRVKPSDIEIIVRG